MIYHSPVLLIETLKLLDIKPGLSYIDATLGHGGHTIEILKKGGVVYGLDSDPQNLEIAIGRIKENNLAKNFFPIHDNFKNLQKIITKYKIKPTGILFDLGLNINQQKSENRGFSFNDSKSLDMRLDPKIQKLTAEHIINTYSYNDLYNIFSKLAQEQYSKPLIQRIIKERQQSPIKNAKRLSTIIQQFYTEKHLHFSINPATKILLALRIAVNDEQKNLLSVLSQTLKLPAKTIVCFISFHSGEDRLIKRFIKNNTIKKLLNLTPKPIRSNQDEIDTNPLARSATLRSYRIV